MAKLGLEFEVEHVRPPGSYWDLIIRCVGSLPDNFLFETGDLPPNYDHCVLGDHPVRSLRALADDTPDRFGRPRVDLVGVRLMSTEEADAFTPGERVALYNDADPDIPEVDWRGGTP